MTLRRFWAEATVSPISGQEQVDDTVLREVHNRHDDAINHRRGFGERCRVYKQKHLNEPFLIIKTAWAARVLFGTSAPERRRLPLSVERIEKYKAEDRLETELADHKERTSKYYAKMIDHVKEVLSDPGQYHPAYDKEALSN